jgi:hypothetical protein
MLRFNVCKCLVFALPLAIGCVATPLTTTISLPVTDVQSAGQLANVRRIAVLDITGAPAPLGEIMAAAITARLTQTGRYQITDRPSILQTGFSVQSVPNGVSSEQAAQLGVRVGADAVLYGEATVSTAPSGPPPVSPPGAAPLFPPPPQQTLLTVKYRLLDSHTKQILLTDEQTLVVPPTPTLVRPAGAPPEDSRQLLANQFAAKVVEHLAPQAKRQLPREFAIDPLALATDASLSRGNRFAESGVYEEAIRCYNQALTEKPDCHEAMYNLGLIAESQGNVQLANQLFQRAMRVNSCKLYIEAYKRTSSQPG